jgi:hypothetical protein
MSESEAAAAAVAQRDAAHAAELASRAAARRITDAIDGMTKDERMGCGADGGARWMGKE